MASALISVAGLAFGNRNSGKKGGFGGNSFAMGLGLLGLDMLIGSKKVVDGPRLEDRSIQVAEYGWRVPTIYGQHRTAGAIVWCPAAGLAEHSNVRKVGGGKQNGSVREFSYSFNGALLVCDSQIERMAEITYNDKIIYTNNGAEERIDSSLAPPPEPTPDETLEDAFHFSHAETASAQTTYSALTNTWSRPEFRIYGGTLNQMPDALIEADLGVGKTPAYRGKVLVVFQDFYIVPPLGTFGFTVKSTFSLIEDVVTDLWAKCGVPAGRLDLSQIASEEVDGFIIDDRSQARDALEELSRNHLFDWVHRDGKEVALKRGGSIVTSIPAGSLRVHNISDGSDNAAVPDTIFKDSDLISIPMREELEFHDVGRNYHTNIRAAWRDATPYREYVDKHARSTSEVLTPPEAKKLADIGLFEQWGEAQSVDIQLGTEYRHLAAGDPVTIPVKGVDRRVRLVSAQKHQFGTLAWKTVPDDAELYNAPPGEDNDPLGSDELESSGDFYYVLLNTNPWVDTKIENYPQTGKLPAVIYAATVPEGKNWDAGWAAIQSFAFLPQSSHDDTPLTNTVYFAGSPATLGQASTILPDVDGGSLFWDETSTVEVDLVRGSLASATRAQVLNGANKIYIGAELVQFTDAEFEGVFSGRNRYTLSGLRRGQRGTEWAMAIHQTNEPVLLVDGSVKIIQLQRGVPNQEIDLNVYTASGTSYASSTIVRGNNLMPYSPVHIKPSDAQIGDGSISFEWDNRTRFADAADDWWVTGQEPPMGEYSEKYEVDVLNGLGGVLYTIRGLTSPSATYTAAQQVIDFGSPQTSIDIKVYQLSQVVGRGYAGSATITP